MSRIKLYLDEDAMGNSLIRALRFSDVDVVTVFEAGMAGQSDQRNLSWSTSAGRVLYTFNVGDCSRIHKQWLELGRTHQGIIVSAQRRFSVGEQLRFLLRLLGEISAEKMVSRLEYLGDWKV